MFSQGKPQCFSLTDTTIAFDGRTIPVGELQIGDRVLAVDDLDRIVSTEVISMIHYENESQGKLAVGSPVVSMFFMQRCSTRSPLNKAIGSR